MIQSRGRMILPLALALAVGISALAVVRTKHENRALVTELNSLHAERERIDNEWGQLRLEEATLGDHGRVARIAHDQLGMLEPRDYVIVERGAAP